MARLRSVKSTRGTHWPRRGPSASVPARENTIAVDLNYNATLQNVVLQAETAYFNYVSARALVRAQLQTVAEADTNLIAAQVRHTSGVATIADVLQAQTVLAQAQLDLETDSGTVRTNHGNLATAMGLRADAGFEVAMPSDTMSVGSASATTDSLVVSALDNRPDLAAARVGILQAQQEVRVWDSTAEVRYLVIPQRPAGTEQLDEEQDRRRVGQHLPGAAGGSRRALQRIPRDHGGRERRPQLLESHEFLRQQLLAHARPLLPDLQRLRAAIRCGRRTVARGRAEGEYEPAAHAGVESGGDVVHVAPHGCRARPHGRCAAQERAPIGGRRPRAL